MRASRRLSCLTWLESSSRSRLISSSFAANCARWVDLWSSISWAMSEIFWFSARFAPSRSETLLIKASMRARDSFTSWTDPAFDPRSLVNWTWSWWICNSKWKNCAEYCVIVIFWLSFTVDRHKLVWINLPYLHISFQNHPYFVASYCRIYLAALVGLFEGGLHTHREVFRRFCWSQPPFDV